MFSASNGHLPHSTAVFKPSILPPVFCSPGVVHCLPQNPEIMWKLLILNNSEIAQASHRLPSPSRPVSATLLLASFLVLKSLPRVARLGTIPSTLPSPSLQPSPAHHRPLYLLPTHLMTPQLSLIGPHSLPAPKTCMRNAQMVERLARSARALVTPHEHRLAAPRATSAGRAAGGGRRVAGGRRRCSQVKHHLGWA